MNAQWRILLILCRREIFSKKVYLIIRWHWYMSIHRRVRANSLNMLQIMWKTFRRWNTLKTKSESRSSEELNCSQTKFCWFIAGFACIHKSWSFKCIEMNCSMEEKENYQGRKSEFVQTWLQHGVDECGSICTPTNR